MSIVTPRKEHHRGVDRRYTAEETEEGEAKAAQTLLTTEQVAAMIGVDPSTLRRWRTAEPVQGPPFIPISERVTKYRAEDVQRWLDRLRVDPAAA